MLELTLLIFVPVWRAAVRKVCGLENMEAVQALSSALNVELGQLCAVLTPAVNLLMQNLQANYSNLPDVLFTTLVGEPITYNIDRGW